MPTQKQNAFIKNAVQKNAEIVIKKLYEIELGNSSSLWEMNPNGFQKSVDGNPYKGMNSLILPLIAHMQGFESTQWITFNRCKKEDGSVKKGSKSTPVLFADKKVYEKEIETEGKTETVQAFSFMYKVYNVFNLDQCDGLDELKEKEKKSNESKTHLTDEDRIKSLDELIKNYGVSVKETSGNRAFYSPSTDSIQIPNWERFKSVESGVNVICHELSHSTGHESRLKRNLKGKFGTESYAMEECIAELSASGLCQYFGITSKIQDHSIEYIASWKQRIKKDPMVLIDLAKQAGKSAELLASHIK